MQIEEHDAISSEMLDRLISLQQRRAEFCGERRQRRLLEREERKLRQDFARHLMTPPERYDPNRDNFVYPGLYHRDCMTVIPIRQIEGVPRKECKRQAAAWMSGRGVNWDGSAPGLRAEINQALTNGETVPEGYFGLHVEITIEIKTDNWVDVQTLNGRKLVFRDSRYS
jgi:hypothetical protein